MATDPEFPGFYLENATRLLATDFREAARIIDPNAPEAQNSADQVRSLIQREPIDELGLDQLLREAEQELGEGLDFASLLNDVGSALYKQDCFASAEHFFSRAFAIAEKSLGLDHPAVAVALSNLAQLFQATNRLKEAEPLLRRALVIAEKSLGSGHPVVAAALNNLAQLLQATNRLEEAEPLLRRALVIAENSLGPDHPAVATALNNLAQLLQAINRLEEAGPLLRRALVIAEKSLGPDHPAVAAALNNLARLLQAINRLEEAEPLLRRALVIAENSLGSDHPDTLATRANIGRWIGQTGEITTALHLFQALLPDQQRVLGLDHPDTLATRANIAFHTEKTGDVATALRLFQALLPDQQRVLGPDHPDTLATRANIAFYTGQTGDIATALRLFQALLPDQQRVLGLDHPDTLATRANIGRWTGQTGDVATVLHLFQALLPDQQRVLGPDHPDTLTTRANIAFYTGQTGDIATALCLFQVLLPDQQRVLGPDHPDTLATCANIAFYTGQTGDIATALHLLQTLLPDQQRVLGPDHSTVATTLKNLDQLLQATNRLKAGVRGSSAIAQGDGAVAVGAGGVAVAGNVYGDVHVSGLRPEQLSKSVLREAYLHRVREQCGYLSLASIDPAVASQQARLSLDAVYTALLTRSPRERAEDGGAKAQQRLPDRDEPPLSALEQLDRHPRLVLQGDPGSGKSTFVNFVALCLAGEALKDDKANLRHLTAPLPDEKGNDGKKHQPWRHGALLPVPVVLRDFAATGLPPDGPATTQHLWAFIEAGLKAASLADYIGPLYKELREHGGLLLLDGLDEVPEAERRREQVKQAVEDFVKNFGNCRALVTSRTYAYQNQGWRLQGFAEATLAPFSDGQIRRFVTGWYAHTAGSGRLSQEDAAGRAELLQQAIFARLTLYELAQRPLLLTLMASLHAWRGGDLPGKREALYAETVDLLLNRWEQRLIQREAQGQYRLIQPSLAEYLTVDRAKVRGVLEALAFEAHRSQPELTGTADIAEDTLAGCLLRLSANPDANPKLLVEYLRDRSGVLYPRGVGIYTFSDRSFQEYLAACYLTEDDYPDKIAELARSDPDRWREVVLLAGAKAARGSAAALWLLAEALCFREPDDSAAATADVWGAQIAAQALVETADLSRLSPANQPKLTRVQHWLLKLLRDERLPATERALAGDNLAALGDPRFDAEHWYLPAEPLFGFIEISAGDFKMGDDPHRVSLPQYYLARWPVTVAQFAAFVRDGGHEPASPNCLKGLANHPVVYVTWHDAMAYCRWLNEQLRKLARERLAANRRSPPLEKGGEGGFPSRRPREIPPDPPFGKGGGEGLRLATADPLPESERRFWQGLADGSLGVKLPSEAEWEKAARGADGRIYPWGGQPDPNKANYDDTGLGTTSAVGCFPGGASPYGCEELSSNVLEWTRSLYGNYPYPPEGPQRQAREDPVASGRRVRRGGAFDYDARDARCAARDDIDPGRRVDFVGFRVVVSPLVFSDR